MGMMLPRLRYTIPQLLLLTVVVSVVVMVWSRQVAWKDSEVRYMKLIAGSDGSPETIELVIRLVRRYPSLVERPGSMQWVILFGDLETCRFFLEHGANPNEIGTFLGEPPLHFAVVTDNPDLARLLFHFGVDPTMLRQDPRSGEVGDTFLHTAARRGNDELCQILIDEQLPLDARNAAGQTPLHLAAQWAPPRVVQILLEHGAQSVPDYDGQTPRHLAEARQAEYTELNLRSAKVNAILHMLDKHWPARPAQ